MDLLSCDDKDACCSCKPLPSSSISKETGSIVYWWSDKNGCADISTTGHVLCDPLIMDSAEGPNVSKKGFIKFYQKLLNY